MKRYLLFKMDCYYPMGGMNDFIKDFDSLEEIDDYYFGDKDRHWFAHVYDQQEGQIVKEIHNNLYN